jgi:hypothetical protein
MVMIDRNEITGELKKKRRTIDSIAKECGCTPTYVHRILSQQPKTEYFVDRRYMVMRLIAEIMGEKFEDVWGISDKIWFGKYLPYNREPENSA